MAGDSPAEVSLVGPSFIGYFLRVRWEEILRRIIGQLRQRGFTEIDPPHLKVFQYPGPQDVRPSDLALRLGMTKQALNYLLGELERGGYITREPDPGDLRSRRIRLTKRGLAVVEVVNGVTLEIESEWTRKLGPRRFEQLQRTLGELAAPVDL